ncbi:MAG: hypothetical protein M1827_007501 [Pycnora praestabilis]|nr:MAG: hypothetical protein M1827_007501 [Pycnora praestabilis]
MSGIVGHLVSRGLEEATQSYQLQGADNGPHAYQLPTWGLTLLWGTALVFLVIIGAIRYTYGEVIATLTMIENSTTLSYVKAEPTSNLNEPDTPLLTEEGKTSEKAAVVEPELLLVNTAPITSRLCTAIHHLRTHAGPLSRFRGLSLWLVYHFIAVQLHHLLVPVGSFFLWRYIAAIFVTVLMSRWSLAWTHIVISQPSSQPWFRRIAGHKTWLKIAPATAVWAFAEQLTIALPRELTKAFGLHRFLEDPSYIGEIDEETRKMVVCQCFAVVAVGVLTAVLVLIPASVTLTRVQASLLSDSEETIIPFDRSFGGKVDPEILGGSGKLGMLDAWRSFDWSARIRLMKLYGKIGIMQVTVAVLWFAITAMELKYIMGDNLVKMVAISQAQATEELAN